MQNTQRTGIPRLVPVTDFNLYEPWPTVKALRRLIFEADGDDPKGFRRCIRKVGRRRLISMPDFYAWIEAMDAEAQ